MKLGGSGGSAALTQSLKKAQAGHENGTGLSGTRTGNGIPGVPASSAAHAIHAARNSQPGVNHSVKTESGTHRANSPVSGSTEKMLSISKSFESNRTKREQLKQQLNKTLNEITATPAAPSPDVNFFPSATNNEFLVLLGLEMCVNRLKREDRDDLDIKSNECDECGRDFSPSWKYDADGRLLCNRCISQIDLRKLTAVSPIIDLNIKYAAVEMQARERTTRRRRLFFVENPFRRKSLSQSFIRNENF